jgi:hypothetical protein
MVTTSPLTAPGSSIERLAALEALRAGLPLELRSRLVGCLEKPDELVLLAESAAWAGRLKLALSENAGLGGGRRVTIKLAPRGATGR